MERRERDGESRKGRPRERRGGEGKGRERGERVTRREMSPAK